MKYTEAELQQASAPICTARSSDSSGIAYGLDGTNPEEQIAT